MSVRVSSASESGTGGAGSGLLIAGLGYCGRVLAMAAPHATVWGTVRSAESATALEAEGLNVACAEFPDAVDTVRISGVRFGHGVITLGTTDPPEPAVAGAVRWLVSHGVERVVYLSSTSVYGDHDGGWVDADTPPAPDTAMGRRRVLAEAAFERACQAQGVEGMVLRLPGIYGPGRTLRGRLLSGSYAYPRDSERWSNRIHVDDVSTAVLTLLERGVPGRYMAADGVPFRALDLVSWACEHLGIPMPEGVAFDDLSPRAKPFWLGSRRCDCAKLRALGWEPTYADYRDGFAAAWRAEDGSVGSGEGGES